MQPKYKFQWYQELYEKFPEIHARVQKIAPELGIEGIRGKVGLYAGNSSCPGIPPRYIHAALEEANRIPVYPLRKAGDELRTVVKDIFGDAYDAAVTNTCEAALRVVFETLFTPPSLSKGAAYRSRFIAPYGEDFEYAYAYRSPFPPRYKHLSQDRSAGSGELGFENKSLSNLDAIYVRLEGVRYEPHGIKFNPTPLLSRLDHQKSIEKIARVAERHACELSGFAAVSYDTPGTAGTKKMKRASQSS